MILLIITITVFTVIEVEKPPAIVNPGGNSNDPCSSNPCRNGYTCVSGTCKTNDGNACKLDTDCVNGSCNNGICGKESTGQFNEKPDSNYMCSGLGLTANGAVIDTSKCLYESGRSCTNDNMCASNYCNKGTCNNFFGPLETCNSSDITMGVCKYITEDFGSCKTPDGKNPGSGVTGYCILDTNDNINGVENFCNDSTFKCDPGNISLFCERDTPDIYFVDVCVSTTNTLPFGSPCLNSGFPNNCYVGKTGGYFCSGPKNSQTNVCIGSPLIYSGVQGNGINQQSVYNKYSYSKYSSNGCTSDSDCPLNFNCLPVAGQNFCVRNVEGDAPLQGAPGDKLFSASRSPSLIDVPETFNFISVFKFDTTNNKWTTIGNYSVDVRGGQIVNKITSSSGLITVECRHPSGHMENFFYNLNTGSITNWNTSTGAVIGDIGVSPSFRPYNIDDRTLSVGWMCPNINAMDPTTNYFIYRYNLGFQSNDPNNWVTNANENYYETTKHTDINTVAYGYDGNNTTFGLALNTYMGLSWSAEGSSHYISRPFTDYDISHYTLKNKFVTNAKYMTYFVNVSGYIVFYHFDLNETYVGYDTSYATQISNIYGAPWTNISRIRYWGYEIYDFAYLAEAKWRFNASSDSLFTDWGPTPYNDNYVPMIIIASSWINYSNAYTGGASFNLNGSNVDPSIQFGGEPLSGPYDRTWFYVAIPSSYLNTGYNLFINDFDILAVIDGNTLTVTSIKIAAVVAYKYPSASGVASFAKILIWDSAVNGLRPKSPPSGKSGMDNLSFGGIDSSNVWYEIPGNYNYQTNVCFDQSTGELYMVTGVF